jgi:UDP-glucose 4-epimerase
MKYIIFGGAGFIGSHISDALLRRGEQVVVVDDFSTGLIENLKPHDNLTVVKCDISNWNSLIEKMNFFKGSDGVFHLAAMARIQPSIQDPRRTHDVNTCGTFNVLEICRLLDIPKIIFSSSSSIYGRNNTPPLCEDMLPDCLNVYSTSKYVGEQYMKNWGRTYGIHALSLRYFNVYGSRSPLKGQYAPVIGKFFRQLLKDNSGITIIGDGKQTRSHTFVGDVVDANLVAMEKANEDISGEVFNVGNEKSYSIIELAGMIQDATKIKKNFVYLPPRIGEAQDSRADISKAKKLLEWEPNTALERGVEVMKNHYMDTLK